MLNRIRIAAALVAALSLLVSAGTTAHELSDRALTRQQLYADTFRNNHIDALIFPTTPLPASPVVGSDETVELNGVRVPTFTTYIRNTDANAVAGIPSVSLPMALTKKGLTVGIEIDGPANSDRRLLGIALTLEKILGSLPPPPGF